MLHKTEEGYKYIYVISYSRERDFSLSVVSVVKETPKSYHINRSLTPYTLYGDTTHFINKTIPKQKNMPDAIFGHDWYSVVEDKGDGLKHLKELISLDKVRLENKLKKVKTILNNIQ
jgi:hypothetical protein